MKNISKMFLPFYCFIALAALPLSSIHVEDEFAHSRFMCGTKHPTNNLHLFFHELFYAHFDNKLDHVSDTPPYTTFTSGAKKDRRNSCVRVPLMKDVLAFPIFSPSIRITAENFVRHSSYPGVFIECHPLCSGLSPPLV